MNEYLNDILITLRNLGPEAFTIVLVIAVGYIPRILPVTNRIIPWVCVCLAPCIYPLLTSPGRVSPDIKYPLAREIGTGFLLGLLAWMAHDKVIRHFEHWLIGKFGTAGSKRYRKTPEGGFEEIRSELEATVDKPEPKP